MNDPSLLLALQKATHATFGAVLNSPAGLDHSPAELNVLATLADGRERRVSDLGDDVGSRPATLTGVLDRLESRGAIRRRAHPTDRRAVIVELTAEGAESGRRIQGLFADVEARALGGLDADERAALLRGLAALAAVR